MDYLQFFNSLRSKINENNSISDVDKTFIKASLLTILAEILESEIKIKADAKQQLNHLLSSTLASLELTNKEVKKETQN